MSTATQSDGLITPTIVILEGNKRLTYLSYYLISYVIPRSFTGLFSLRLDCKADIQVRGNNLSQSFYLFKIFLHTIHLIIFFPLPNSSQIPSPHNFIFSLALKQKDNRTRTPPVRQKLPKQNKKRSPKNMGVPDKIPAMRLLIDWHLSQGPQIPTPNQ